MKEEGFYSANEFDLIPLLNLEGEIMELGRSCVDPAHRTISMMQLLWRAVAVYVQHYQIKVLCGCASLNGIEPVNFKLPLSYLYHHHLAYRFVLYALGTADARSRGRARSSRYAWHQCKQHALAQCLDWWHDRRLGWSLVLFGSNRNLQ